MATIRKHRKKWQVQVRRQGQPPISRSFIFRQDAQAWARQMEVKQDRGEMLPDLRQLRTTTITDLLERYRTTVTIAKRSAKIEAIRIASLQRTHLAKLSLAAATTDKFAVYRDQRLTKVAPATVRKELALLRHVFRIARQEWHLPIEKNPIADLKMPSPGRARTRRVNEGEAQRLEEAIGKLRNPVMRGVIRFAIETGMRRGEILKSRVEHLDLQRRILTIPDTKNGHPRTIPLTSAAIGVLEAVGLPSGGFIFPVLPNAVRLAWERVRRRAGVPDMHFHDLRHEAISRFFERGLTVPEVALISGHRDVRMLFRYTHLKAEDVAARLASIESQPDS